MALKNLKQYSGIDLSKYENGFDPTKSDALTGASEKKQSAESAYNTFLNTGYQSQYATLANDAMNAYLNRDPFSYDFNADALYQQYKDKYIQQGKMAMQDTMGQAAAMTGGYGNSYAASVGNQAYQAQLNNLNDVIPELYQLAYDRYNQQGQDMLNQYSLLTNADDRAYGMWNDELNRLMTTLDYYTQEESNLYNREYGAWNDNRNYDTNQYWNETNFGYQFEQDEVANILANREMAIREAQNRREQEKWDLEKKEHESGGSGSGSGTGNGGGSGGSDDKPLSPQAASAGKVLDEMVQKGTTQKGKTIDKSTVSGQREITSAINKEINAAVKAGELSAAEAAQLKKKYNPRGYTK